MAANGRDGINRVPSVSTKVGSGMRLQCLVKSFIDGHPVLLERHQHSAGGRGQGRLNDPVALVGDLGKPRGQLLFDIGKRALKSRG